VLLPLSGDTGDTIIQYLMNVFIDTPNGNFSPDTNPTLVLHNGKADIQADKDGWREGLRYISRSTTKVHPERGRPDEAGRPRGRGDPWLGDGDAPPRSSSRRGRRTATTSSTTRCLR
jgi:hypothetical protein